MRAGRIVVVGAVVLAGLLAPAAALARPSGEQPPPPPTAGADGLVDNHASRPPPGLEAVQPGPAQPAEVRGRVIERPTRTVASAAVAAPGDDRSLVSRGLPVHLDLSIGWVAGNVGLSLLLLLLLVGAAQLFNDTIRANHEDLARRLRRVTRRFDAVGGWLGAAPHVPPLATFVAVAGVVALLADPNVSLSSRTVAQMVGMSLAFGCLVLVYDGVAARTIARGSDLSFEYRVYPLGLAVAVASMLVSRVFHIAPGVVYGLVAGFVFAVPVAGRREGAAYARSTALTYGAVLVGFVVHRQIALGGGGTGFGATVLDTAAAAVCVGGLQSAVVQLLPMRFVNGEKIAAWNRAIWFGLLALGLTLYLQLVVRPAPGASSWESVWFAAVLVIGALALWGSYQLSAWRGRPPMVGEPEEAAAIP